MTGPPLCPLCGQPLYGWIVVPGSGGDEAPVRVIDRCENCGVALARSAEVDLAAEWRAIVRPAADSDGEVAVPDRASLQAAIGGDRWAALDLSAGALLLTRSSLELLAERNGHRLERLRWPAWGPNQPWMWQTLINGLTFHRNFAREVRAGRLRPATARSGLAFAVDALVTALGAPLVALVSFPLEAAAALFRRGGVLRATARAQP